MSVAVLVPFLLLMAGALLATGVGWRSRRPRPAAAAALGLLTITGIVASLHYWHGEDPALATLFVSLGGLLALTGGAPVTMAVFQLVDGSHEAAASSVRSAGEVLRGGAWIGVLERGAVFATLVTGWPEGLVVALGLKGLGRYPELRNQEHTGTAERFIIGTFTSVLWAAACAGVTHLVLS
jgi:hypothetical protein